MGYFLMTNDVECFSFEQNKYDPKVAKRVLKQGLPRLLDLYDKYDVNATFFYTGRIIEIEPEVIDIVKERGTHEIGCHGYSHELEHGFDIMSMEQQEAHMKKAKEIIEKAANTTIISFRAPAARINCNTIKAMEKTGFKTDSSISSQRFDGPLSFGAKNKIRWLFTPRMPYRPSRDDPFKKGNSKVLELPISAFIFPLIGTTMRVSMNLTKLLQKVLSWESKRTEKPIIFVIHPNEVMEIIPTEIVKYTRGSTVVQKLFADNLRQNLKLKCMGLSALKRLEEIITYGKKREMSFITCKKYLKRLNR